MDAAARIIAESLAPLDRYRAAEHLAEVLHAGQKDKAGEPYFGHLVRVAARAALLDPSDVVRSAAVLHDSVEDGHITLEELAALGVPSAVLGIVERLTRREGETYAAFIDRVAEHVPSAVVKFADLLDNADPVRLAGLDAEVAASLSRRYARHIARLANLLRDAGYPVARLGVPA